MLTISVISRLSGTSELADILNTWEKIVMVFTEKKKISLSFSVRKKNFTFLDKFLSSGRFVGNILGANHKMAYYVILINK